MINQRFPRISTQTEGSIRMAVVRPYFFVDAINQYCARHPQVNVIYGRNSVKDQTRIHAILDKEGFDLLRHEYFPESPSPEISFLPLMHDRLCLLCGPGHPLADRECVGLEELEGFDVTCFSDSNFATGHMKRAALSRGLRVSFKEEVFSDASVFNAVSDNELYVFPSLFARQFPGFKILSLVPEIPFVHGVAFRENCRKEVLEFAQYLSQACLKLNCNEVS